MHAKRVNIFFWRSIELVAGCIFTEGLGNKTPKRLALCFATALGRARHEWYRLLP